MTTIFKASSQWASRPADERFLSLTAMADHFADVRSKSRASVVASRDLLAIPYEDNRGLAIITKEEGAKLSYSPTHFSFGQLAQLAEAPAGYLRTLPSPMAADCINYGLQVKRDVSDVGLLVYSNGDAILRAATGPKYGRIWNDDIVRALIERFGDGITGAFRVPGEFGKQVVVDKSNTTLYASDRDMFVFLADEEHRIEVPNRRNGEAGQLARGFFVWNSEVGDKTFGVATFLFDYVCCNRIVWGAQEYKEITVRHTASAPAKFIEEITPALQHYAASSADSVVKAVELAKKARVDNVDEFLKKRFGTRVVDSIKAVHMIEEGRPIESLWDAATAITAYARSIPHQDARVDVEREGGKVLALAS